MKIIFKSMIVGLIMSLLAAIVMMFFVDKAKILGLLGGVGLGVLYMLCIPLYHKKYYVFLVLALYILTSGFTFVYGRSLASEVKRYTIVEDDKKTYISLGVYDKHFILAPFNKKNKEFINEYKLVEIKDVESFEQEKVGLIKLNSK